MSTNCDIQKKNNIIPWPSKPYGYLGLLYCLLSNAIVHWEAQRNITVTMEHVGLECTGVCVVRES